jgi:hypothetical protein
MLPNKNPIKNTIQISFINNLFVLIGLRRNENEEYDIISLIGVLKSLVEFFILDIAFEFY